MHLHVESSKFRTWKIITIVACAVEIAIISLYVVLIALDKIPHIEEVDEESKQHERHVSTEQLMQEIFNKILDGVFHGLGIYGAVTQNHGVMVAFHVLTLLSKYFAISEAITNNYYWPYAGSAIIVFALCAVFYKQLRIVEAAEQERRRHCGTCGKGSGNNSILPSTTSPKEVI